MGALHSPPRIRPPFLPSCPCTPQVMGLKTLEDTRAFFNRNFPQLSPAIRDADLERFAESPCRRLPTFSYVGPVLHRGGTTVLLGAAIHAVNPYFGQVWGRGRPAGSPQSLERRCEWVAAVFERSKHGGKGRNWISRCRAMLWAGACAKWQPEELQPRLQPLRLPPGCLTLQRSRRE
eukprot:365093-Chlamydomonas_euryale.AAC.2